MQPDLDQLQDGYEPEVGGFKEEWARARAQFKAHNYLGLSINYLGLDLAHNMMLFWLDKAQFDLQLKNAQNTVTSLFMASNWKFLKT